MSAQIPPQLGINIANCARALSIARQTLEAARGWEERQIAQRAFDAAEAAMNAAALQVNRGITCNVPPPA